MLVQIEWVGNGWLRITHRGQSWLRPFDHTTMGLLMECVDGGHRLATQDQQPAYRKALRERRRRG